MVGFFIGYPLFERMTKFREFHSRWTMMRNFQRLRTYEEQIVEAESSERIEALVAQLDTFEQELLDHWVDEENIKDYYLLRAAFQRVRETIASLKKRAGPAAVKAAGASTPMHNPEKINA